jgi:hypothetical protein
MTSQPSEDDDDIKLDLSGQITVTLEGQEYVLRPSHRAIINMEKRLNRSLFDLAGLATQGRLTITEMAVACVEMMRAHAEHCPEDPDVATYKSVKEARLEELIFEASAPVVSARLTVLLMGALTGGYTASGEMKATGMTMTPETEQESAEEATLVAAS